MHTQCALVLLTVLFEVEVLVLVVSLEVKSTVIEKYFVTIVQDDYVRWQ